VLAYLRHAVLDRKAAFPLSSTHYAELQGNANYRQRTDVATVMSLLSGHKTISGIFPIRRAELERALHDRFGRPTKAARVKPLGWGIHFALGEPAKR
jgi:phage protein U